LEAQRLGDTIRDARLRNLEIAGTWQIRWTRNAVGNLLAKHLYDDRCHSLRELENAGKGRPAVVFGGGASLDDVLDAGGTELLRSGDGNPVIMCPNSCTRQMLARGIEPTYWTAIHPTPDVVKSWALDPDVESADYMPTTGRKLITAPTVHPYVLRYWLSDPGSAVYLSLQGYTEDLEVVTAKDEDTQKLTVSTVQTQQLPADWYGAVQHYLFNCGEPDDFFPPLPWHARKTTLPVIPNQGCVGNYSVLCAMAMGCDPILLVGVDYSFVPDKDGHPRWRCDEWRYKADRWERIGRNPQADMLRIQSTVLHEADTIDGGRAMAHEPMVSYRNSLHLIAEKGLQNDGKPLRIVNCGGGICNKVPKGNLADYLRGVKP
jgi:hypothetical protein